MPIKLRNAEGIETGVSLEYCEHLLCNEQIDYKTHNIVEGGYKWSCSDGGVNFHLVEQQWNKCTKYSCKHYYRKQCHANRQGKGKAVGEEEVVCENQSSAYQSVASADAELLEKFFPC